MYEIFLDQQIQEPKKSFFRRKNLAKCYEHEKYYASVQYYIIAFKNQCKWRQDDYYGALIVYKDLLVTEITIVLIKPMHIKGTKVSNIKAAKS